MSGPEALAEGGGQKRPHFLFAAGGKALLFDDGGRTPVHVSLLKKSVGQGLPAVSPVQPGGRRGEGEQEQEGEGQPQSHEKDGQKGLLRRNNPKDPPAGQQDQGKGEQGQQRAVPLHALKGLLIGRGQHGAVDGPRPVHFFISRNLAPSTERSRLRKEMASKVTKPSLATTKPLWGES